MILNSTTEPSLELPEWELLECNHTEAWEWVYSIQPAYMSVICILGVLGNAFVLCVFCIQMGPCSVADIYLGNLAAADFLMVCCLPFWVTTVIHKFNWSFGKPMCQLVNLIIGMNYYCSVLFLTLVSLDRYLVLARPMSMGRQRGSTQAKAICMVIWLAGFLLSLPALLFRSVQFFPDLEAEACYLAYPHDGWRLRFNMTVNVVGFLIPVPLVCYCSYHIIAVLGNKQVRRCSAVNTERKAAVLVLVVLFVFILCWLPFQMFVFLDTLYYFNVISGCPWINCLDIGTQLSTYLGYSNSSLNPFLYVIVGKHFRQRAKGILVEILNCGGRVKAFQRSRVQLTCKMDEVKPVSAASFQLQNTTDSPSLSMTFNSSDWHLVYAIVPPYIFILCLTGILGNAFVLLVFFLQRSHWTIPEIYLGNLALADLILLAGLPFWAMNILNYFYWPYGEFLCKVVNLSIIVNMYTSIYMLVMVNVDRYLALVLTMKARWLRRRRNAKAVCFCLWVFGLAMGIPTATYRTVQNSPAFEHAACIIIYPLESLKVAHSLQLNLLGFALPLLAIVFCSCNIVRALHKRRQNVDIQDGNDRKATVLVCAVTLLFLLCWGPFHIITFLDTLCDLHVLDMMRWYHALDIGSQFSTYLAFLNSCLNPLLYVCTGHYFRRKVSEIYKRRRSSVGSVVTALQRSVVSTYVQRTDQIKPVVL
ncbi:hypothetical protein SRHO_G00136720 [Serrasalmus rhombeus]